MSPFSHHQHSSKRFFIFLLILAFKGVEVKGTTFTFVNKCDQTVWPGILGKPDLGTTGFELKRGTTRAFQAPTGWSGRFWARTACKFDNSGHGTCATGDCGSGEINCNGNGAAPPATLAEFTLGSGSQDYYDVSLVDGYNLPMVVEATGGSGSCATTGCSADLNRRCPSELSVEGGDACQSACRAFEKPEYCCSGAFDSPSTCKPSMYSQIFKSACPKSYSYAFDDASSTFTCTGSDYTVTFCPSSPSLKSLMDSGPGQSVEQAAVATTSWIANLATGASTRSQPFAASKSAFFVAVTFILSYLVY
ncbi:thaumatin-like protein 1 [Gastrolobium bilobum]|uniref:thaumatin-like protein 1 n=1 Tax=Gastrolobium bilobum TaxID=150636 RepID=UPI002AB03158|nr:thaumatin-like protein 1 [Gastrolobium bilobum]